MHKQIRICSMNSNQMHLILFNRIRSAVWLHQGRCRHVPNSCLPMSPNLNRIHHSSLPEMEYCNYNASRRSNRVNFRIRDSWLILVKTNREIAQFVALQNLSIRSTWLIRANRRRIKLIPLKKCIPTRFETYRRVYSSS